MRKVFLGAKKTWMIQARTHNLTVLNYGIAPIFATYLYYQKKMINKEVFVISRNLQYITAFNLPHSPDPRTNVFIRYCEGLPI